MKKSRVAITGVLFLDKPQGMTSQQAVTRVKYLLNAEKAGHTGSLDPLATGMLPICLGEATKFSDYLLVGNKTYVTTAQLGVTTTTGDAEGDVLETREVDPNIYASIDNVIGRFKGSSKQIPPMYSALKVQGQPLYRLARRGVTVDREARDIIIEEISLLNCDHEKNTLTLRVSCSKGTYIRTLVEDIGSALGCGAHVTALRRTQVEGFKSEIMVTVEALETMSETMSHESMLSHLHSPQILVSHLPAAVVHEDHAAQILQGNRVSAHFDSDILIGRFQILTQNGTFLGVGDRCDNNIIVPKRVMRAERVKML